MDYVKEKILKFLHVNKFLENVFFVRKTVVFFCSLNI